MQAQKSWISEVVLLRQRTQARRCTHLPGGETSDYRHQRLDSTAPHRRRAKIPSPMPSNRVLVIQRDVDHRRR